MVQLAHRVQGQGSPVILVHGLFGSMENLGAIARLLAGEFEVHSLDMRNHGRSPHTDHMDYATMSQDILKYMNRAGLDQAAMLGHSMGGKTVMQLALNAPERVTRLVVADIAPVRYPPHHQSVMAGLSAIGDPSRLTSRAEADAILKAYVPEDAVRLFLLKNLVRAEQGFSWRINLPVIRQSYDALMAGQDGGCFPGPVLFIKGGASDYIRPEHRTTIARLFPNAQLKVIPGTGHWLHAEKPQLFARIVSRFLKEAA
ncbi:alpha/beta fold hydrolase [Hahella sp. SMD15-11]|uniref:Alpha/beta fold hydrolase n=1 Tax=Thermohahella caldifontis TaxID=3142973 RepID=A0AB39UU85_9GAMM